MNKLNNTIFRIVANEPSNVMLWSMNCAVVQYIHKSDTITKVKRAKSVLSAGAGDTEKSVIVHNIEDMNCKHDSHCTLPKAHYINLISTVSVCRKT